jgi:SRSO17 transposase
MDVELQILKHLSRDAQPTVSFIDKYCKYYKNLFPEVRSYECFKYLHLGIISAIKRKSLPEIAQVVGLKSAQSLHHFIAVSPWLDIFPNPYLLLGFYDLIHVMNQFPPYFSDG